eukprot:3572350-Rhodomonas_salina.1
MSAPASHTTCLGQHHTHHTSTADLPRRWPLRWRGWTSAAVARRPRSPTTWSGTCGQCRRLSARSCGSVPSDSSIGQADAPKQSRADHVSGVRTSMKTSSAG